MVFAKCEFVLAIVRDDDVVVVLSSGGAFFGSDVLMVDSSTSFSEPLLGLGLFLLLSLPIPAMVINNKITTTKQQQNSKQQRIEIE